MKNRSDYEIIEENEEYILIKDLNIGNRSVTNDVENVVADLIEKLNGKRLFYQDTMYCIDEILIRNNKFFGFRFGGPK